MKPKVIAIVGPTSSGKTALGIWLAKKIGGEIISADSRQVYKGLNLGTGKVTKAEMAGVPHHLLDVANPKRQFSVDTFVKLAQKVIVKIEKNKKTPIIVGGTGLYVDMLLGRMSYPEVPPNPALRSKLDTKSAAQLFTMLQRLDPRRAKTIDRHNPRRLVRAIEIAKALGKSPLPTPEQKFEVLWIGLNPEEKILQKRIKTRLQACLKAGMVAEAKRLHTEGLSYKRMHALGLEYRSLARFLKGEITKQEMVVELKYAIGNYAKRQMRWFKRNTDIRWIESKAQAFKLSKEFLSGHK